MSATPQTDRKKQMVYVLLLGLLCAGIAARIGFFFWQTARADQESQKITRSRAEYNAEHRFDWMKEYLALEAPRARMSDQHPCVYESMNQQTARPHVGKCKTAWSLFSEPVDQFEVDLRYGAFVLRQTDLFLNDGMAIPFTRAYDSLDWFDPNPLHAFGRSSNHTYDISPLGGSPGAGLFSSMSIALEDGDFLSFERISPGTNYSDGLYRHTETSGRFYKAVMYWNGTGWTTKLADGSCILFPDSYGAKKISDGAATEIDDDAGNKLRLVCDANSNLQEVQTPHGHLIRLSYNNHGWIKLAEDDQGHWASYQYNPDGMLATVLYSSGKKRQYEYEDKNLTAVRDEENNILVQNAYDQGRVIAQQFADGQVYRYSYRWSSNWYYIESAIVRFPDGTEQTIQTGPSVPDLLKRNKR